MKPLVKTISSAGEAARELRDLHVSGPGIDIMAPKATHRVLKIFNIDSRGANILKQEMLSRGGEVATPWEALKMEVSRVDVIIMGTLRQYEELCGKLQHQPFGLRAVSREIMAVLSNYDQASPKLEAGRFLLDLAAKTHIMGVLNITPDSFSDGGRFFDRELALEQARRMVEDGADILDVGGESTRPGAEPVSLDEELRRVVPVIETLAGEVGVPVSIDSYKPEVVRAAVDAGASIINDINGLRDEKMVALCAETGLPVITMHMQGTPRDMQQNPTYSDVVKDICEWLDIQAEAAQAAGVARDKILIDPGIGFGKTKEHNLEIIARLPELKSLGYPVVLGTSRKAFIGAILDLPSDERIEGTIASVVSGIGRGAQIVRVHDVKEVARAVRVTDAIVRGKYASSGQDDELDRHGSFVPECKPQAKERNIKHKKV